MERTRVSSPQIRGVGYDRSTQTLEVELSGGAIYQFERVPEDVHRRLRSAPSAYSFYQDHIEDTYTQRRVR